jgi:predicted short-subunit dehydrogenase-like oxidoreductase (DUF2520 family)
MIKPVISFAGAGRVAGALCKELFSNGFVIDLIVSENKNNGKLLADGCKAGWSDELSYPDSTDIIIVAVPDKKLHQVLDKINCRKTTLVVHTAGSFGLEIFPLKINRKGVFYPLQTFSPDRKINFKDLPFFIDSSDSDSSDILKWVAENIGSKVYYADTEHRKMLHLAAVFTCNFTNHMLTIGKEIASRADFPFEILKPLIQETILKAIEEGPDNSQTGPAVRNDQNTIGKHLELLTYSPEYQKIYGVVTKSIISYYCIKDKK